ncbi:MAG: phosphoesterase PA-phosphatase related protein [Chitinophagaceae bacterium]|nr:phosphoesterase PA-phosphatase related protein [Chitinophagaceae bacterium]
MYQDHLLVFMKLKCILPLLLFLVLRVNAQEDTASVIIDSVKIEIPDSFVANKTRKSESIYHLKKGIDYPVVAVLGGTSIYLMMIIYSKPETPASVILNLNKNAIPPYDRWNAGWHDANLDKVSYYPFYAVMPLPLLFLADRKMKNDLGKIGVLYLESFALEGIIYSGSVYFVDRFRPDVYNTNLGLNYRTNGNFRNSFFAGHVAVVANSTFFMSSVFMAYHPHSKLKWVLYGTSAAATLGMSYMRIRAGKHFVSDVATGILVGVGCGLLTPELHKNRNDKRQRWSLNPDLSEKGGGGFTFTYKL